MVIRRDLGNDVRLDDVVLPQGSIEVILVVSAEYKLIKDFNEYVEAIRRQRTFGCSLA